ncbi:hypothetical protein AVEN_137453-1 [Araneus ventricosus]|uniref:Uncharacterized protein n=1 Tax=Araneus ventricosus TaxID=182803 RepID=A0A4Y2JXU0_ARAVE|nr:hypothetical protein AVEN_137453-1 [Araneus ventricosus]
MAFEAFRQCVLVCNVRWATLGVKARPICPAKVSRHWSQVRLLPFGCSLKRSCTITLNHECSTPSLTFDEIYSIRKNKDLKTWRIPPSHDWYKRSSPGGSIGLSCDRADQTALSRFVSGHLRSCSFSHGNKVFPVCAKCGVASASPEHILSCLRLSRETFETDPLLALDFLRVSGLMDGV